MKYLLPVFMFLFLAACGNDAAKVQPRAGGLTPMPDMADGLTYAQFRNMPANADDDMMMVQKRFLSLDRDNNGLLTSNEYHGE